MQLLSKESGFPEAIEFESHAQSSGGSGRRPVVLESVPVGAPVGLVVGFPETIEIESHAKDEKQLA